MLVSVLYLILHLISIMYCYMYGLDFTPCPHPSQRTLRAKGMCSTNSVTLYQCLYNLFYDRYTESCYAMSDYLRPGQKYVMDGVRRSKACNAERYQPFQLWSNVSSHCILQRSKCNEIGQVIYNNGSTVADRVCRCDYTKGFAFLSEPHNRCYCIPSMEDCTCYKKQCPGSGLLSQDYTCSANHSTTYACRSIIPMKQDESTNGKQNYIKDNRKIEDFGGNSITAFVIMGTIGLMTLFWVVCCICGVRVYECINKSFMPHRLSDFDNEHEMHITASTCLLDDQKVTLKILQIIDEKEDPEAKIKYLTDHLVLDSRTVIQQKNLNSPSIEHFYPSRKSMSSDEFAFTFARKPDVNKSLPKMSGGLNYLPEVSTFEKSEYIKTGFMDCIIDKRMYTPHRTTMKTSKNLKNLLIKCNDNLVNCDVDRRLHTKLLCSDESFKRGVSGEEMLHFAKLVCTIHYVDRNTMSSKFWKRIFWPAIENKDSILCLFLLTIMTGMTTDQWKECNHYLLEGLLSSMTNQDKDTSKVIAWFITKKLFRSFGKSVRKNITDIWPAFKCNCHRKQHVFCSDKIAIYIEMNTLRPDLPETFWKIDVKYITDDRTKVKQGNQIHEHLQNLSGKIHFPNKISISGVDAKQLFNEHSNLSLICKSPFKSIYRKNEHTVIEQSCFQLYCKRKGIIPIGENHFPRSLNDLQTDIMEGSPHFLSQLKIGNQVGTDEFKRGTLGGFVQVRGDTAFLTCLHVFLSADELASENISLDDEKTVPVKLYRENGNSHICGKIREMAFEVDNEKETSIDAALVEISVNSIDTSDYVNVGSGKLSFKDIGMKSEYLNNSCVDYRPLCFSIPQPILSTISVGALSGCWNSSETILCINKDTSIDLEPIDETYSKVIIDEIKTNVNVVIQSLKQIPIAVSLDDYTIKMNIEKNCDCKISSEMKNIVIDVIKNIYSTTQCTNAIDIDRLIHEHVFCKTQSSFSSIIGDVHMQLAFLKKTGKNMAIKRTSRQVCNQIYISNIPFQPGDSGTCIYVLSPFQGCIGMAIADHPQGGCIATPIMDILKHFKIRIK